MKRKSVDLQEYEAEAIASLVKLYLRELPENIFTAALTPKFNELSGIQDRKTNWKKPDFFSLNCRLVTEHCWHGSSLTCRML
ncbi:RalA-binding protein 1 [Desmophyllum pertusum]|uniref:RalA-binding protein 1 n=1 Tax=Desmophyllum pertusum TaxID=174260 RepID=A0A9W9ZIQ3_9CNID|nr:RalA-binding protein 1 [Desmophyllum pertusum]